MPLAVVKSLASSHGRHIYIGIGAYRIDGTLAAKHIADCRSAGAAGVVLYSYHYLGPNSSTADTAKLAEVKASTFAEPTTTAPMAWKGGVQ